MTKDEALTTDRFHYGECVKTVGPRGGVTITREEWRRRSVLDGLVLGVVSGEGPEGYRRALEMVRKQLDS